MKRYQAQEPQVFAEGPIDGVIVRPVAVNRDQRGWLLELYRQDELSEDAHPVMSYLSETLCGVTRGPHEHVDQTDYFAFVGPGEFALYMWDVRADSPSWGKYMKLTVGQSNRRIVLVPPGVVHAYRNIGTVPGWVFNAANRLYAGHGRREPVDEIRHEQRDDEPYRMD
jgi:dTDP-4-dehydrorhamnose 3,5-epimerase